MINKIYSMIGICMKAGMLAFGSDMCIENIKINKIKLLIIAQDASLKTRKKFIDICEKYQIKYHIFGDIEILSKSIGKNNKAIIGIMDRGFSEKIDQMVKEITRGESY